MDYEAQSWLEMTRSGGGAFDEIQDVDGDDYTPRDVPMTVPRHAAVAAISYLNARFDMSAGLEGDHGVRAAIVDVVTAIINQSVGEGPFDLATATKLNQLHGDGSTSYQIDWDSTDRRFDLTATTHRGANRYQTTLLLEAATAAVDDKE